jgi:hypothetical protein
MSSRGAWTPTRRLDHLEARARARADSLRRCGLSAAGSPCRLFGRAPLFFPRSQSPRLTDPAERPARRVWSLARACGADRARVESGHGQTWRSRIVVPGISCDHFDLGCRHTGVFVFPYTDDPPAGFLQAVVGIGVPGDVACDLGPPELGVSFCGPVMLGATGRLVSGHAAVERCLRRRCRSGHAELITRCRAISAAVRL